jgi:hypothetical protein
MMKLRILKVFALVLTLIPMVQAGGRNFGVGFILGQPTAISAKYWTSANTALDFGVGWGLGYDNYNECWDSRYYYDHVNRCNDRGYYYADYNDRNGYRGLHVHADYLFHNFNVIKSSEKLPIYYGPGVALNLWRHGDTELGFRGVCGLAWMPRTAPLDLFFEIAPVMILFPGTWVDINAGIGGRFYF